MSTLDWSFIALLSSALLFFLLGLLSVILAMRTKQKLLLYRKRKPKNKRKRKQFLFQRKRLIDQKKRQLTTSAVLLILMLLTLSGAYYSRYYQRNHLYIKDSDSIVQSYYLVNEAKTQLMNIKTGENPQKAVKNLREISLTLSSYGARKAYQGLATDGQLLLNRHFAMLKELGVNLSSQTLETLEEAEVLDGYFNDLQKVVDSQKKVFVRFKVNEAALKQGK